MGGCTMAGGGDGASFTAGSIVSGAISSNGRDLAAQ